MIGTYLLSLAFWLVVVCILVVASLWVWKRFQLKMPGQPATRSIAVRETMMISPGLRLAVIDFEGRRLLVSVGRGGVTLIDRIEADDDRI